MKSVLVVGTGTIGEPLIGLLSRMRDEFGIDEVWFHKRTPLRDEYAKVESLISQGAKLAVDKEKVEEFKKNGAQGFFRLFVCPRASKCCY